MTPILSKLISQHNNIGDPSSIQDAFHMQSGIDQFTERQTFDPCRDSDFFLSHTIGILIFEYEYNENSMHYIHCVIFAVMSGAQKKTTHNLRLICGNVLDLCKHKTRPGG